MPVVTAVLMVTSTMGAGVAAGAESAGIDSAGPVDAFSVQENDADATLSNGSIYYFGMDLYRDEGVPTDASLDIVDVTGEEDVKVAEVWSNRDSELLLRTDELDLPAGRYAIRTWDNRTIVEFRLSRQQFDVGWNRSVVDNEGRNTDAELAFESNRENFTVIITANSRSGFNRLSGEELQSLFPGVGTPHDLDDDGENESLEVGVNYVRTLDANFTGVRSGTFSLTARVPDTGEEASKELEVGTVDAEVRREDTDGTIRDGETYYVGMELYRTDGIKPAMNLEVFDTRDTEARFLGEVASDYDGELGLQTDDMVIGPYELRYVNGTTVTEFTLLEQSVSLEATRTEVTNGTQNDTVELFIDSNRGSYPVHLNVSRDGQQLDPMTTSLLLGSRGEPTDVDGDGDFETLVLEGKHSQPLVASFQGQQAGTYDLSVVVPDTGATDETTLTVVEGNESDTGRNETRPVTVTLAGPDGNITAGETTTVTIGLNRTYDGVVSYDLSVSVNDSDVAGVESISAHTGDGVAQSFVSENGSVGDMQVVNDEVAGNLTDVSLVEVTIVGRSPGTTDISPVVEVLSNQNNDRYTVVNVTSPTVTVGPTEKNGIDVTGDGNVSDSVDDDPYHEDLNGDDKLTVLDVQLLYRAVIDGNNSVTERPDLFDFNGDETVDITDVQLLFAELGS